MWHKTKDFLIWEKTGDVKRVLKLTEKGKIREVTALLYAPENEPRRTIDINTFKFSTLRNYIVNKTIKDFN